MPIPLSEFWTADIPFTARRHGVAHRLGPAAREGVLSARVVAADALIGPDAGLPAVGEVRLGSGLLAQSGPACIALGGRAPWQSAGMQR
jgi:hypothetical protein